MILVKCGPIGVCDSTKTEKHALLMGLQEQKFWAGSGSIAGGDSLVVVSWEKEKKLGPWCNDPAQPWLDIVQF